MQLAGSPPCFLFSLMIISIVGFRQDTPQDHFALHLPWFTMKSTARRPPGSRHRRHAARHQ